MSEQYGDILQRDSVFIQNACHRMAQTVDRTVRQPRVFLQPIQHPVDGAQIGIRFTERITDDEILLFKSVFSERKMRF